MDNDLRKKEQVTRALFCRWSRWYDSAFSRIYFDPLYRNVVSSVKEQGKISAGAHVLDVACGTGEIINRLAPQYASTVFMGVDFTPAMIEKAIEKNKALTNVKFKIADANDLTFPENSFELVICTEAFHHFFNPKRAIREMHRVLKPNGKLLLVDPAFNSSFVKKIGYLFKKFENAYDYYSAEDLKKLIIEADFEFESSFKKNLNNFIIARKI